MLNQAVSELWGRRHIFFHGSWGSLACLRLVGPQRRPRGSRTRNESGRLSYPRLFKPVWKQTGGRWVAGIFLLLLIFGIYSEREPISDLPEPLWKQSGSRELHVCSVKGLRQGALGHAFSFGYAPVIYCACACLDAVCGPSKRLCASVQTF